MSSDTHVMQEMINEIGIQHRPVESLTQRLRTILDALLCSGQGSDSWKLIRTHMIESSSKSLSYIGNKWSRSAALIR